MQQAHQTKTQIKMLTRILTQIKILAVITTKKERGTTS